MSKRLFLIYALCVAICLASSSSSNEDVAKEFIEHILRIPNTDTILNSVLGRLERSRQQGLSRQRVSDEDCDEPSELLPEYTETLQSSRERELRQLGLQGQKHYPICHLERKIKKLNTNEYEYRPAYYEEIRCTMAPNDEIGLTNEICSSLGFACVQWNKTIHLTRRRYSSFPSNPFTCAEWISIIARERRDEFYKPAKNSVICSDHFDKSDISGNTNRRRLVKTAVKIHITQKRNANKIINNV